MYMLIFKSPGFWAGGQGERGSWSDYGSIYFRALLHAEIKGDWGRAEEDFVRGDLCWSDPWVSLRFFTAFYIGT